MDVGGEGGGHAGLDGETLEASEDFRRVVGAAERDVLGFFVSVMSEYK